MSIRNAKNKFSVLVKYKKFIFISIITGIFFFSYKYFMRPIPQISQEEKIVEVEIVHYGIIRQTADFIGTIRSGLQTTLTAQTKGILDINSKPGEILKKGWLIAKIGNENIERNYKILKELEEIARLQFYRSNSLLKSGTLSENIVEEKKSILLKLQKELSDVEIALEETKIYAPFDGVVGLFKLREGSQVNLGDSIVQFYDPKLLIVEFDVPAYIATQVKDGARVFINSEKYYLTHIQKMLDEETHMCPAYIQINCPGCIIGTTTNVNLVVQEKQSVIVIPFEAIFFLKEQPFVYIIKENKATLTPVELGIRDKKIIEVISGLKEGDQLIVYGHNRIYPGSPVISKLLDSSK